jgi:hypothetical protein
MSVSTVNRTILFGGCPRGGGGAPKCVPGVLRESIALPYFDQEKPQVPRRGRSLCEYIMCNRKYSPGTEGAGLFDSIYL